MSRNHKKILIDFPSIPNPTLEQIWTDFKPVVEKLKKEKGPYFSGEFYWWRSRYADFLKIGAVFNREAWEKQKRWDELWDKYGEEIQTPIKKQPPTNTLNKAKKLGSIVKMYSLCS